MMGGAPPRRDGVSQSAAAGSRRRGRAPSAIRQAIDADVARLREVTDPPSPPVLHLPLPPRGRRAGDAAQASHAGDPVPAASHGQNVDLGPVLQAWMAPLVGEVARLRVELAELRAREQDTARGRRGELTKLLAGILVCFVLVAAALVLVIKG